MNRIMGPANPVYIPDGVGIGGGGVILGKGPADPVYIVDATGQTVNIPTSVKQKLVFSTYIELNARNLDEHVHGTFTNTVSGSPLSSVAPITYTHGIGKLFFDIRAGSDINGTMLVTGTRKDRNTGAETPGFTENIVIDALTVDTSNTDAEGNIRHAFSVAYVTDNWFKGSVTISTTDLTLTDVDVYAIAFNQVNDTPVVELKTFDITFDVLNTSAWFYAYLYSIVVESSTKKCALARNASLVLDVGDSNVATYRLKLDNLTTVLDGRKDGFWYELHFGPAPQRYFADFTAEVWFYVTLDLI